jgi:hypothetical protein
MSEQGKRAGSASALLGTLQYSLATISSVLVARLHEGGPLADGGDHRWMRCTGMVHETFHRARRRCAERGPV